MMSEELLRNDEHAAPVHSTSAFMDDVIKMSKTIRLEEHDVEVNIPLVASSVHQNISVQAVIEVPPEMVLKEGEAIISVGLKFSPSGLRFSTPVKVTVPHCAIFARTAKARVILYTRDSSTANFSSLFPSTNEMPRCDVRQGDLDLFIDHFSDWWIVAQLKSLSDTLFRTNLIGKRLICTPYRPISMQRNTERCIYFCLRDDLKGVTEEPIPDYEVAFPGEQFLIKWGAGHLNVSYLVDQQEVSKETLQESSFYYLTTQRTRFILGPEGTDKPQVRVSFELKQDTKLDIDFHLQLKDAEVSGTTLGWQQEMDQIETIGRTDDSDDPCTKELMTPSSFAATTHDTAISAFEMQLLKLSRICPHERYADICISLGFGYDEGKAVLAEKGQNYKMALLDVLMKWRNRTKFDHLAKLKAALIEADVGGLINKIFPGQE